MADETETVEDQELLAQRPALSALIRAMARKAAARDIEEMYGKREPVRLEPILRRTCVYRHFDSAFVLLYVGVTVDPKRRLQAHRSWSPWFDQVANITVEWFDTSEEAYAAEAIAIVTEDPIYNVLGKPRKK